MSHVSFYHEGYNYWGSVMSTAIGFYSLHAAEWSHVLFPRLSCCNIACVTALAHGYKYSLRSSKIRDILLKPMTSYLFLSKKSKCTTFFGCWPWEEGDTYQRIRVSVLQIMHYYHDRSNWETSEFRSLHQNKSSIFNSDASFLDDVDHAMQSKKHP